MRIIVMAIDRRYVEEEYFLSSGPGGQNVNRRETGVRLRYRLLEDPSLSDTQRKRFQELYPGSVNAAGELLIRVTRERSREQNRRLAYERLEERVAQARRAPKRRIPTKPSRAVRERRLKEKRRRSERKQSRRKPGLEGE